MEQPERTILDERTQQQQIEDAVQEVLQILQGAPQPSPQQIQLPIRPCKAFLRSQNNIKTQSIRVPNQN